MLVRVALLFALVTLAWAHEVEEDTSSNTDGKTEPSNGNPSFTSYSATDGFSSVSTGVGLNAFFHPFGFGFGPLVSSFDFTPKNDFNQKTFYPWPFFNTPVFTPWYKGPDVCTETKDIEEPEVIKTFLGDFFGGTYSGSSESCRGTDSAYVCYGRKSVDGETKFYITKTQCCHGFVRAPPGQPGCVESPVEKDNAKEIPEEFPEEFPEEGSEENPEYSPEKDVGFPGDNPGDEVALPESTRYKIDELEAE